MKLHIGCGEKVLKISGGDNKIEVYKNVDLLDLPHIDYRTSADNLYMIEDNTIEEIYACHVLEHFGRYDSIKVINEWYRVLKHNGILRIAVPNFESIVKVYSQGMDIEKIMGLLYGGQNYKYNFHYQTFDFNRLKKLLHASNFKNIQLYNWEEFLPENFDDFSRAYLPHMDFENGTLMSLNVKANK